MENTDLMHAFLHLREMAEKLAKDSRKDYLCEKACHCPICNLEHALSCTFGQYKKYSQKDKVS